MNSDVFEEILKNNPQLKIISDTSDNSKRVVTSKPEKTTPKPQNIGKGQTLSQRGTSERINQNKRCAIIKINYPGSVITENHAFGRNGKQTFMKFQAREWQNDLIILINNCGIKDWQSPIKVKIEGVYKNLKECPDNHNYKIVFDSIQKATGINDKLFYTETSPGIIDKNQEPHLIITISEV
jgi:hypothetical protein